MTWRERGERDRRGREVEVGKNEERECEAKAAG
jgi:hypothetical protein